jgi:hypothetical protein
MTVVTLGLLMTPGLAAATNGPRPLEVVNQDGKSARAVFESSKGCVRTTVTVQLSDVSIHKSPGGKDRQKDATIAVEELYDEDLGPGCARLDPVKQDSDVEIVNPKMSIDSSLKGAHLHGEARLHDAKNGIFRKMKFDITWVGKGRTTKTRTHDVQQSDGKVITTDTQAERRSAQARGYLKEVLPGGKVVNYVPRPSLVNESSVRKEKLRQVTRASATAVSVAP